MSSNTKRTETGRMRTFLAEHPRLMGALFTMLLLLMQAGQVAGGGSTYSGP